MPERLREVTAALRPQRVLACEPGEWCLMVALAECAAESGVPLEWCADTHHAAPDDTGQFALLAGLSPQAVEDWYPAMFIEAVEWVELPNTAGMALQADGGRFTSKPHVASA